MLILAKRFDIYDHRPLRMALSGCLVLDFPPHSLPSFYKTGKTYNKQTTTIVGQRTTMPQISKYGSREPAWRESAPANKQSHIQYKE